MSTGQITDDDVGTTVKDFFKIRLMGKNFDSWRMMRTDDIEGCHVQKTHSITATQRAWAHDSKLVDTMIKQQISAWKHWAKKIFESKKWVPHMSVTKSS